MEEYECNIVYRKIRSHHQTDGSEPEMVIEVVEIYLCDECEPWHVHDIARGWGTIIILVTLRLCLVSPLVPQG